MPSSATVSDWNWDSMRRFLPFDLDTIAVETGALTRRRGVSGGEALVHALLLCGLPKASLERASVMAKDAGIANLNPTALFKRLSGSERLLSALFQHTLSFSAERGEVWNKLNLVAVDATCLCGPAAKTTDQKLHTVYDLSRGIPRFVEITDRYGGERLNRHSAFGAGDLVIADSGYGHNKSFLHALNSKARILMRFQFATVVLNDEDGNRIWEDEINRLVPQEDALDFVVFLPDWEHPLRAVGSRNDKGVPVWILTDLSQDELPTYELRQLYRRRWQVELFFKRLKSLLDLDELPTRDGPTARPWIWAKLILASLATLMAHERFSPWGVPEAQRETKPVGTVRLRHVGHRKSASNPSSEAEKRKTKRQTKTQRKNTQTTLPLEA